MAGNAGGLLPPVPDASEELLTDSVAAESFAEELPIANVPALASSDDAIVYTHLQRVQTVSCTSQLRLITCLLMVLYPLPKKE